MFYNALYVEQLLAEINTGSTALNEFVDRLDGYAGDIVNIQDDVEIWNYAYETLDGYFACLTFTLLFNFKFLFVVPMGTRHRAYLFRADCNRT